MKKEDQDKILLIIDHHDHDRLKEVAEQEDLNIQQLIRRAIKNYLQYIERKSNEAEKIEAEKKRIAISDEEWEKVIEDIEKA